MKKTAQQPFDVDLRFFSACGSVRLGRPQPMRSHHSMDFFSASESISNSRTMGRRHHIRPLFSHFLANLFQIEAPGPCRHRVTAGWTKSQCRHRHRRRRNTWKWLRQGQKF